MYTRSIGSADLERIATARCHLCDALYNERNQSHKANNGVEFYSCLHCLKSEWFRRCLWHLYSRCCLCVYVRHCHSSGLNQRTGWKKRACASLAVTKESLREPVWRRKKTQLKRSNSSRNKTGAQQYRQTFSGVRDSHACDPLPQKGSLVAGADMSCRKRSERQWPMSSLWLPHNHWP